MQSQSSNFPDFGVNKNGGFCECRCGEKTKLAPKNIRRLGWIKGEPIAFVKGHNRRQHPAPPKGLKRCCKCLEAKSLEEFPRSRNAHDRHMQVCKICSNAMSADYKARNSDKIAAYNRTYVRDKEQRRLYFRLHPEVNRRSGHKRRALQREAGGDYTSEEVRQMYADQDGLCAYCERPLDGDDYHIDHMTPLSRGGRNDWTNLAISCPPCNRAKYTKTVEEFVG